MNDHDMLAGYEELARLSAQALAAAHARDWEAFASQQQLEAAALAALRRYEKLQPFPTEVLSKQKALIRRILDDHRQTHALITPWREEIVAQLQSASSSRMLARTYGTRDDT